MNRPVLGPPPSASAPLPPPRLDHEHGGVRFLHGVPYADRPAVRPLELDLVLPAAGGPGDPAPLVLFLHGGGWRAGSRRSIGPAYDTADVLARLAAEGVAVASADYRLSGEAPWPAALSDVLDALAWCRDRAADLDVDPDRVALWGESAGGHLAALLGLHDTAPTGAGTRRGTPVRAVAAWYTPSDLARTATDAGADPHDPGTREAQLLGAPPVTVPGLAADASPVERVHAAAPPFLLLHGRADRFVPVAQSERLHAALTDAGVPSRLETYDDADHLWLGSPTAARDALDRTRAFLLAALAEPTAAPSTVVRVTPPD